MSINKNINEAFDFDDSIDSIQNDNDFFAADTENLNSEIEGFNTLCEEIGFANYFDRCKIEIQELNKRAALVETGDEVGEIVMHDGNFANLIEDFGKIKEYLKNCHYLHNKIYVDFYDNEYAALELIINISNYTAQDVNSIVIDNFDVFEFEDITFPQLDVYINIDDKAKPQYKNILIKNVIANNIEIDGAVRVRFENCYLINVKQSVIEECYCPEFENCKTNPNEQLDYCFINSAISDSYDKFYEEVKTIESIPEFSFHTNGARGYAIEFYSKKIAKSVLRNKFLSYDDKETLLYDYLLCMEIINPNAKETLMSNIEEAIVEFKKENNKVNENYSYTDKIIIPYLNESYLPDIKDLKRIKDMINKANGDVSKEITLATKMCNSIKDVDKMGRRYNAAVQIAGIGHPITNIFAQGVERMNIQDIDIKAAPVENQKNIQPDEAIEPANAEISVERPKRKYTRRAKQQVEQLTSQEIEALNTIASQTTETVEAVEEFIDKEEVLDNLQIFKQYGKLIRDFNAESKGSPFYKGKEDQTMKAIFANMQAAVKNGVVMTNKLFARLNSIDGLISIGASEFNLATMTISISIKVKEETKYRRNDDWLYNRGEQQYEKSLCLKLNASEEEIIANIKKRGFYEADITTKVKTSVIKNIGKAVKAYINLFLDVVDLDDFENAEKTIQELYSIKNSQENTLKDYFKDPLFSNPDKVEYDSKNDIVRLVYSGNNTMQAFNAKKFNYRCVSYDDFIKQYVRDIKENVRNLFKYANSPRNENRVIQIPGVSVRKWLASINKM